MDRAEMVDSRDFVLRAMIAAEIADSCNRADLRDAFNGLAEAWLEGAVEQVTPEHPAGA